MKHFYLQEKVYLNVEITILYGNILVSSLFPSRFNIVTKRRSAVVLFYHPIKDKISVL